MDYALNQAFGKGQKLVKQSKLLRNYSARLKLDSVDENEEDRIEENSGKNTPSKQPSSKLSNRSESPLNPGSINEEEELAEQRVSE